jgi:hypothetical protein
MTLTIELSPELERRLAEEAARRGQQAGEFARAVLEERLAPDWQPYQRGERTPEQILADAFARFPRRSPEDLSELVRQQGIRPITHFEDLLGEESEGEEEFDVDAFLAARKQWQWEGRPPGGGLAEVESEATHQ